MDDSTIWLHLALLAAGVASGFINTVAGGGSLLTLPALMLLGLPADIANGTNRPSILAQSVVGVAGFRRHGKLDQRRLVPTVMTTMAGAAVGAVSAALVPAAVFKYVLLTIMVTMAGLMAIKPTIMSPPENVDPSAPGAEGFAVAKSRWGVVGLFGAGLYGGFVQAGVGILLLAVLSGIYRYDLVRANALKLACVSCYGAVALGIFAMFGQVDWIWGGLLTIYCVIGTLLGVRFAINARQRTIQWIVFFVVIAMCVKAALPT